MELQQAEEQCFQQVCSLGELQELRKKRVMVGGRAVVLFHLKDTEIYALDHFCYHSGGPLELGDIEDYHGRKCVVCPWHKHSITLDTGESLYTAIDPSNLANLKPMSKGVKQRTHDVKVEGSNVFVRLTSGCVLDSDRYYTEQFRTLTENVLKEPLLTQSQQWNRFSSSASKK